MVSLFFRWKTAVLTPKRGAIMHGLTCDIGEPGNRVFAQEEGANGTVNGPALGYSPVSDSGQFLWLVPVEPQPPDLGVSGVAAGPVSRSPR